jgi:uncharacterized membrane protein YeiB
LHIASPSPYRDAVRPRLVGLDIARGLAVLGMTIVNVRIVAAIGGETGPGWLRTAAGLLDGRAAATFVVLAGVGTTLLVRRGLQDATVLRERRLLLLRRAAFLSVLGLAFWWVWPADILHYYGAYLAIGALVVTAPRRVLAVSALASSAIGWWWVATGRFFENWDLVLLDYHGFWTASGFLRNLLLDGFHPVAGWLALYLAGIWLGRLDLGSHRVRLRLVAIGGVALLSSATVSWLRHGPPGHLASVDSYWDWMTLVEPLPPSPGYLITGLGAATLTIGLSLIAADHLPSMPREILAAAGRASLTLYLAHVFLLMGALESAGQLETASLPVVIISSTVFWLVAAVAARAWEKRFRRGPVELLMRGLTDRPWTRPGSVRPSERAPGAGPG